MQLCKYARGLRRNGSVKMQMQICHAGEGVNEKMLYKDRHVKHTSHCLFT